MRRTGRLVVLAVLVLAVGRAWSQEPARPRSLPGAVVKVVSGDTIHVFVNGEVERVRYIGVVAPDPGEGAQPGDPIGRDAVQFNRGLVYAKNVRLELDVQERDAEGRMLAYVWLGDVMVNAEMVGRGFGQVPTGTPNVRHQELLLRRQQEARASQLGIWRRAAPAPPPPRGKAPSSAPTPAAPRTAQGRPGIEPTDDRRCPPIGPITPPQPLPRILLPPARPAIVLAWARG